MQKSIFSVLLSVFLVFSIAPAFAQTTNSTVQDFTMLQQQKNENSAPLSYAVFYITENDKCSDTEYASLKFYQVITQEYLALYDIQSDLQGSLCIPEKSYEQYFSGLSTYTLPIVISDNAVGQKLVQQGFYGMYEITGTGSQAIYVCSCDTQIESWAGAWVLSHELSHFALRYFGEPDAIAINWVHYIQALVNQCQNGDFSKVCPQYSTSVTAPSGNLIPMMVVYGQGPSSDLPKNAPQSEVSTTMSSITQVSNPTCQNNQICILPGDYVTYQVSTNGVNQTVRFDFVNPTDNKNITVKTTVIQNGTTGSESDMLDMSESLFTRPNGQISNFMYILPTPLKLNNAYHEESVQFNNYQRNVMSGQNSNQTNSILVEIDQETGILVQLTVFNSVNINGKVSLSQTSYKLLDTNKIHSSNVVANSTSIPPWIKQDAQLWSNGSIPTNQFAQGIQYLITQGIVSQTNTGTNNPPTIPVWVKTDAKYWSEGLLSDDEFVKSIQYLITNRIIHV
ncbi:MAG: hypothetical protein WA833_03960 [Nitrosotalea sp.]